MTCDNVISGGVTLHYTNNDDFDRNTRISVFKCTVNLSFYELGFDELSSFMKFFKSP